MGREIGKSFSLLEGEVMLFTNNEACGWWVKQNLLKFSGKQVWYSKSESFICIDVCYNWILLKLRAMGYSLKWRDSVCIHSFTLRTIMVKFVKVSLNFKSWLILFRFHFNLFWTDVSKTRFLFVFFFCINAEINDIFIQFHTSYQKAICFPNFQRMVIKR